MWTKRRAEERRTRLRPVYDPAKYTDSSKSRPRIIPHMSSPFEDFKLPFAIAPQNEDLVNGRDTVLAFDMVAEREGREFLTSSWRGDQAVCLWERTIYIDCHGRLDARPLRKVVYVLARELQCHGRKRVRSWLTDRREDMRRV
jgi:hypothetical protein